MDPQQELFSAVLMALKEKYKDTGVGVYDTILPPKDTPYPFIYLADCSESDQATKVYRTYSALCLEYAETNTKDPAG